MIFLAIYGFLLKRKETGKLLSCPNRKGEEKFEEEKNKERK